MLEVGGVGPWEGAVIQAHQGAAVGAVRRVRPLFEDTILMKRTKLFKTT